MRLSSLEALRACLKQPQTASNSLKQYLKLPNRHLFYLKNDAYHSVRKCKEPFIFMFVIEPSLHFRTEWYVRKKIVPGTRYQVWYGMVYQVRLTRRTAPWCSHSRYRIDIIGIIGIKYIALVLRSTVQKISDNMKKRSVF